MKIDAHQHFWSRSRGNDYGFLTEDAGVLYHDYLPTDLAPLLRENAIDYTITVQAAPTVPETEWLLELTQNVEFVIGVVGWLDFDSPSDEFGANIERLKQHTKFVGLRPMLQDLPDDHWILRPQVLANLKIVAEMDLPFDILVYPRHLPYIAEMLERVGGLRAVVDHAAKPYIRAQELEPWSNWMEKISQYSTLYCKVSGLVTEADLANWRASDIVPYIQHISQCFGQHRLMFGSDWPVCLKATSYNQVVSLAELALPATWGERERQRVFGRNAAEFYGILL